jgi:hypothetical protein
MKSVLMCAVLVGVGFCQHLKNVKLQLELNRYKELYDTATLTNELRRENYKSMETKYLAWEKKYKWLREQNYILTRKFRKTDTKEYRKYLASLVRDASGIGGDKVTECKKHPNILLMGRKKKKEFDFKKYEDLYGDMYHLVLDRPSDSDESIKFVSDTDYPKFAGVDGNPLFFNWDKEFRIATDYVIMYPKVYVRASEPFNTKKQLTRCYVQ